MKELRGLDTALQKKRYLPELFVLLVLFYIITAWIISYLVDVHNYMGLRDTMVSSRALHPPVVWYALFREGGMTEILQWIFLGSTAFYARSLGKELRTSEQSHASSFWFLFSFAVFFMFMEDAFNIRHGLSFLARLVFSGFSPVLVRTFVEGIFFFVLGSIPVYALIRYGRDVLNYARTRRLMLGGFAAYALAVGASGSRYIYDWYTGAGRFIHETIGRGSMLIPPGWDVSELEFFLMDWIVEESIELLGASFLFAATLCFYAKVMKKENELLSVKRNDRP